MKTKRNEPQNQLLVVVYTERGQITRLISARTATRV